MSKRKHDDVHSVSCSTSGTETFVLGSPGSECLSGTCECHGKDTVTSASRLSASSPTCLTCASNGPFSTSQLRNGNANPRCISCIGGIFDTPTQRRKSSSALPDKDRIAKLCQPTPLLDIDLPLDDFIARAQAFAAEVTDTYGEHLAEPDLPHLFNGWNTFTPEEFFALDAIAGSSLAADRATPKSVRIALEGPDADNWSKALATELSGMKKHKAWTVIRKGSDNFPTAASSISSQMVFKVKADKKGNILKFKCRLVARGDTQQEGVNYDDTFSPVVRIDTVRTFFAFAAKNKRVVRQIDYEAAFLQAELASEAPIYMRLPPQIHQFAEIFSKLGIGPDLIGEPGDLLMLNKSIYGLKQAGLLWGELARADLESVGFVQSQVDQCLYRIRTDDGFEMDLLLYVDDCIYASNDDARAEKVIDALEKCGGGRAIERLGEASWFLGMSVEQDIANGRITLSQPALAKEILRANEIFGDMTTDNVFPANTPCSKNKDVDSSACPLPGQVTNALRLRQTKYRTCVGKLLYLTRISRPDMCFAVSRLGRFSMNPGEKHFAELRHLLRYLKGTVNLGLTYHQSHQSDFFIDSNSFGAPESFDLLLPSTWSDSDWAGEATTRLSISGFAITFCGAVIAFGSERQSCISLSTAEAELVALARSVQECIFIRKLVAEFMGPLKQPTFVFVDNKAALDLVRNNVFHKRTKHIDIKHFFAREKEADGTVITARVPTEHNLSDSFTKGVDKNVVARHRFDMHGMELDDAGAGVFVRRAPPTAVGTTQPPARRDVKRTNPDGFGADVCRCSPRCAEAGSDTAHGSHGYNCMLNYERDRFGRT